jgi:hypothetical protein
MIWVTPPLTADPSSFELLVWMRGPYRNLGVLRECFNVPLEILWQSLCLVMRGFVGDMHEFKVAVRYPQGLLPGSGEKLERAMWLSFFYDYDFRRQKLPPDKQGRDLILERRYTAWRRRQTASQ